MQDAKGTSTPMGTNGNLDSGLSGNMVNQKEYQSLIGSLLYVTASRLDVMFSVCACVQDIKPHLERVILRPPKEY